MQRFINDPDDIVDETVQGFVRAHRDRVRLSPDNPRVVVGRDAPVAGKVGVVSGGGSGHEPAFIGYVGRSILDAAAVGELFSAPTAQNFLDAIRAADGGAGVVVLYGNYAGDDMNVKMAARMAAKAGHEVLTVVANDDVSSAPADERHKRRGVAGEVLMWMIGGARAAQGASAAEVQASTQRAIDATRSVGVGLAPCTLPTNTAPNFEIEPGKMEMGIGHHGEPGTRVADLGAADAVADEMLDMILADHAVARGDEVAVLVSGLGATPLGELYVLDRRVDERLAEAGITVHRTLVGDYFTSLEMMGASVTLMKLDAELRALLDAAAGAETAS